MDFAGLDMSSTLGPVYWGEFQSLNRRFRHRAQYSTRDRYFLGVRPIPRLLTSNSVALADALAWEE